MNDVGQVVCEHRSRRRRDGGGDPTVIGRWGRDARFVWSPLWEEHAATVPLSADAEHERTAVTLANAGQEDVASRLVDYRDRVRLRGGATETRRGWRLLCGRCGHDSRPKHQDLVDALEEAHAAGAGVVTLAQLDTRGA